MTDAAHISRPKNRPLRSSLLRFLVMVALLLIGYVLLLLYSVDSYAAQLIDAREQELQRVVNLGLASLDPDNLELQQYLSLEQIRRNAAVTLRDLADRYALGENQLIMLTDTGLLLVFPPQPDLELTEQLNLQDADGVPLIAAMLSASTAGDDERCLRFRYTPEAEQPAQEFLACMQAIPQWDAVIGVMLNLEPTLQQQRGFFRSSTLLTFSLLTALVVANLLLLLPTLKSYDTLRDLFRTVRISPDTILSIPVDQFPAQSEGRILMEDFARMLGQIRRSTRAREEAVLAERSRLARELHDAVSQTLFSANLIAEVLPGMLESQPEEAVKQLGQLQQLTRGAQAEMRTLLVEMRPEALLLTPLEDLISQLLDGFVGRYRIPVRRQLTGGVKPPNDVKMAFYRIAQEALHNIAKHSRASEIRVMLEGDDAGMHLRIQDDGMGFNTHADESGGLGLHTMRERAESIGAAYSLQSAPGEGTCIEVAWEREMA